ncbi:Uncharacterised protein [Chlamydia trachomatis]|nr:Uncharacterised protein [Chlamydia trachomatis]
MRVSEYSLVMLLATISLPQIHRIDTKVSGL